MFTIRTSPVPPVMSPLFPLLPLFLLLLLCATSFSRATESFQHRTQLPLHLRVWLIGEDSNSDSNSGSDSSDALTSELRQTLQSVLPSHLPTSASELEFDISYDVVAKGKNVLQSYKSAFQSTERDSPGSYSVLASSMSNFLEHLLSDDNSLSSSDKKATEVSLNTLPIWIVLPNDYLPPHKIWSEHSQLCSQTFVGDVLFVDLSASACDDSDVAGGRGALAGNSASDEWHSSFPSTSSVRMPRGSKVYLQARLSNIVVAAAKQFIVSSVAHRATHSAGKILCPIVFLTTKSNSNKDGESMGEVLSHATLSVKELDFLTTWVQSFLLPHQEVHVLATTHYVEDHPQLSLALAAASRSYPAVNTAVASSSEGPIPEEVVYLDSDNFLSELAKTGDSLTQRLLLDAGHGFEGDLMLEVEALFQNLRVGTKEESKLERWMGDQDPHNFAREPKDGLLSDRYTATHERTKIVPLFVLSDIVSLESKVDENSQQILTKVPLFDQESLVSFRKNMALVLHSTAYNTRIFEPNLRAHALTGAWTDVDLSDPTLLIAEGLAGSLAGLKSPHFRANGWDSANSEVDFTWGLGTHPFSPFSHIDHDWREHSALPRFSGVLSWASRRGVLTSRANAALHRLYHLLDHSVLFVKDLNRVLALFYELQQDRGVGGDSGASNAGAEVEDDVDKVSTEYHNAAIDSFLSEVFIYDLHEGSSFNKEENGDSETVSSQGIEELAGLIDEYKIVFRTVLQRILDIKAGMADAVQQGDLLHISEQLAHVETEIHEYKDKFTDQEGDIRELLGRCEFKSLTTEANGGTQGNRSQLSISGIAKVFVFGLGFVVFTFVMKKIQEIIESRNKKYA